MVSLFYIFYAVPYYNNAILRMLTHIHCSCTLGILFASFLHFKIKPFIVLTTWLLLHPSTFFHIKCANLKSKYLERNIFICKRCLSTGAYTNLK